MKKKRKVVLVAASMSAGKSSLINALVGQEILHSANQATTSKLTRIHIDDFSSFKMVAHYSDVNQKKSINSLSADLLKKWNQDEQITEIDIHYSMVNYTKKRRMNEITILDTPGANNSVNESHHEIFIHALKSYPESTLLYILNTTQLATNDDVEILKLIHSYHSTKKIIFVLNKVDLLDEEKDGSVKGYVQKAKKYLEDLGFFKPNIIPIMALPALADEKRQLNQPLTRQERHILTRELERFQNIPQRHSQAAVLPFRIKRNWQRRMKTVENNRMKTQRKLERHNFSDYTGLLTLKNLLT